MENYKNYINYILNAADESGGVKISYFDDDWVPIGARVREQLKDANLIYERDGKVFLIPVY